MLLKLDLAETREFFAAFFALSDYHWHGFLSSRLSFLELIAFGLSLFAKSSNAARINLLQARQQRGLGWAQSLGADVCLQPGWTHGTARNPGCPPPPAPCAERAAGPGRDADAARHAAVITALERATKVNSAISFCLYAIPRELCSPPPLLPAPTLPWSSLRAHPATHCTFELERCKIAG